MKTFVCVKDDCPNKDVVYNVDNSPETVECGGCKEILVPND
jgi:ribosomal protein S27E